MWGVTVYESDLPGVGKKHEIELDGGERLVVVTHNTGKREVFRRADEDADAEKLFDLSDPLARQVGTILEGAYFQPVRTEGVETALDENGVIEWVRVAAGSRLDGATLAEADVRAETGASVIAVQRDAETVANPDADFRVAGGDTLVAIGGREDCRSFRAWVEGEDETGDRAPEA
jgi:TrkA domain protein